MNIYQYPNYLDFIKNEKSTLAFLMRAPFLQNSFNEIAHCAEISFYNLPQKNLKESDFSFGCNFNIEIENSIRKIAIEAIVRPNFSLVSYVLSICENNETPFRLIRKFHFDYALPNKNESRKPIYHIQYGGELTPELRLLNTEIKDLQPWLSSPRIRYYPINLALLLDMVFNEFRSDETNGIINRPEWRNFIKNNEDTILKPFYNRIVNFLNSDHKSNNLLRDFYYGTL